MAEGYQKAGILPENEGGTGAISVSKALYNTGIIFRSVSNASVTISFKGSMAMLIYKRYGNYGIYLFDYWGADGTVIASGGSGVTITKPSNSFDITVTTTASVGSVGVILFGLTNNYE